MTETRFTWRWLLVIAVVGIGMGLFVGLAAGWLIAPNFTGSNPAGLSASAQNDYIVLVANTYSYDQDLARARQRLSQLQDKDISARVERLAKALAARNDVSAANVADLAVALGSESTELLPLAEIAASDGWGADTAFFEEAEPTKVARVEDQNTISQPATQAQPTETPLSNDNSAPVEPTKFKPQQATKQAKMAMTATAEAQAAALPAATAVPTDPPVAPPAEPAATAVPQPPPPTAEPTAAAPAPAPVTTEFTPGFPSGWYSTVSFIPANVAPGQKYWRLKSALYCDRPPEGENQTNDTCPGYPGGENDHTIYASAIDENGNCVDVVAKNYTNLGETFDMERKDVIYPWNSCNVDYEKNMNGEGNDIWIEAEGLPSDRINGLVMNSPRFNWSENKLHVRYFLVFQRTTR